MKFNHKIMLRKDLNLWKKNLNKKNPIKMN